MKTYELYVESGPKQRKTMVHVMELLGCIANGPTSEEALDATPAEIQTFLRFLARHGDEVDAEAPFTTKIAQYVVETGWIGQGDPMAGFATDFEQLTSDDLRVYIDRLGWIDEALLAATESLSPDKLLAKPAVGRPILDVLQHLAGARYGYLQPPLSKPNGMAAVLQEVQAGPDAIFDALRRLWAMSRVRLESSSDEERESGVQHGQKLVTARRAIRRMLEHDWEHLREIERRLGVDA